MTTQTAPLRVEAPPGNPRYPLLDPLRAVAALSVLTFHFVDTEHVGGVVGRLGDHGNVGVALFFLISGFLLYRPFVAGRVGLAPPVHVGAYYRRRLLRIVPGYWVALTVLAIYPGLHLFGTYWPRLYGFGQVYGDRSFFAGLSVAWTLCVEMSFYLVLPGYAALLRRQRGVRRELGVLGTLAVASLGLHSLLLHTGHFGLSFSLLGSFHLFAVGMALALLSTTPLWSRLGDAARWAGPACFVTALLCYLALAASWPRQAMTSINAAYIPIAALLLLPTVMGGRSWLTRALDNHVLCWLGTVSYGIYLWHSAVLEQVADHTRSHALSAALGLGVTVAVAGLSYYVVESPFLRLKRRTT